MGWKVIPVHEAQIARVDDKGVKSVLAHQLPVLCVSPPHKLGASSRAQVSKTLRVFPSCLLWSLSRGLEDVGRGIASATDVSTSGVIDQKHAH